MTRDVHAPGALEAMYVGNVAGLASGRVEELPIRPGVQVNPSTVLVVLSSPDEDIKELTNEQALNQAVGNLASLKNQLRQQILSQQSLVASTLAQYNNALRLANVQDSLFKKQLSPKNDVDAAHDNATEAKARLDIVRKQLEDIQ